MELWGHLLSYAGLTLLVVTVAGIALNIPMASQPSQYPLPITLVALSLAAFAWSIVRNRSPAVLFRAVTCTDGAGILHAILLLEMLHLAHRSVVGKRP